MTQQKTSLTDRLLNLGLLALLAYLLLQPEGPIRARITDWQADQRVRQLAREHWDALAATTARVDTLLASPALLVEFSDYECPFCRRSHGELQAVLRRYPDATIALRHYPLSGTRSNAGDAARAAICAEFQGRFREMNALLFESDDWQEEPAWRVLAAQAGVPDVEEFVRCHDGPEAESRLQEDMALAQVLNVTATPTFFFAYGARVGYLEEEKLVDLLELER